MGERGASKATEEDEESWGTGEREVLAAKTVENEGHGEGELGPGESARGVHVGQIADLVYVRQLALRQVEASVRSRQ